ncbi:MAG: superinfection immunity protein [Alphaproteobacteria bacterium]|nr:superinfection immunity protein [Alphaproteobacteria bacterium]
MVFNINFSLILQYAVMVGILVVIFLTPSFLAAENGKSKYDNMRVRVGSWLFGWSFIGWIFALFISSKK